MDLHDFWNTREPLHRWSMPETDLHKHIMGDLVEWIRFMASDNAWPRILDVGCGSGRLFNTLSKEGVQVDVEMVDFVLAAVKLCEENTGHTPKLWDGEVLPYDDNSFDVVVMMDFLLHVHPDKVAKVLAEARRVSNYYVYCNTTVWDQKSIADDTWCFSHDYDSLFEGLTPVMSKTYPAKKELKAYLFRVERKEKTLMEAIEEQIDDDFLQVESEDEGDIRRDDSPSGDESSLSDDPEVG